MAVKVRKFKAEFPEFRATDDALIQAKLNQAARRIHAPVWGDMADDGVMFLAAHLVSISPTGEHARLKPGEETQYEKEWNRMKREVTTGFRVTGPAQGSASSAATPAPAPPPDTLGRINHALIGFLARADEAAMTLLANQLIADPMDGDNYRAVQQINGTSPGLWLWDADAGVFVQLYPVAAFDPNTILTAPDEVGEVLIDTDGNVMVAI